MSLWLVRAGRYGEQEQGALEHSIVTIGWNGFSDLSNIQTREELHDLYSEVYPDRAVKKNRAINEVGQVWRFMHEIQKGDLVALPLKTQSAIAIGKVEGDYEYEELANNIKHIRRVNWLKTIPRSAFDQNILYSLGAFMTVCKIERNDAENRIKALLHKKEVVAEGLESEVTEEAIDIEQYAKDQIVRHVDIQFKGHKLARLVDAILKAQGYVTTVSPPGPDGGVDILAAAGPLGFDKPRVCVQVKSSSSQIDVTVVRELQGVMIQIKAEQGLFVAWGGFKESARKWAKDAFFSIRLWDQGDLLNEIFKYYDRFDDELKAELPLKRIWGVVIEE